MQNNVRISREDTGEILYQAHNTIVNSVKFLFARLLANTLINAPAPPYPLGSTGDPLYGIWGLSLGSGSTSWAPETQPDASPVQTALVSEFLRKPLSGIQFVDSNYNPLSTLSTFVNFQTTVNATTDNITQGIREMGLIGGGTYQGAGGNPTNMLTAPYFNPNGTPPGPADSVVLCNYLTLAPLILPAGVNIQLEWIISC
jgi:hypothetical protein